VYQKGLLETVYQKGLLGTVCQKGLLAAKLGTLRVQKPFASSWLSPIDVVALLRAIVNWRKPIKDFSTLFVILSLFHLMNMLFCS
jgi:hypothetical protein